MEIGDEVYMLDCILRRCKVGKNLFGEKVLVALDAESENKQYRVIAPLDEAIKLMQEKLTEIKQGA